MKRFIITLLMLLASTCCGAYKVDNGVSKYIESFKFEGARRNKSISITDLIVEIVDVLDIRTPTSAAVGVCLYGVVPKIQLLKSYWDKIDEDMREQLMFHELGHCILNRSLHTGYPGIMNYMLMSRQDYVGNRDAWIDELFNPGERK